MKNKPNKNGINPRCGHPLSELTEPKLISNDFPLYEQKCKACRRADLERQIKELEAK